MKILEHLLCHNLLSLAYVPCANSDNIKQVQPNVLLKANCHQEYVSYSSLAKVDLKIWQDCCKDLQYSGTEVAIEMSNSKLSIF